uniref:Uncharacterized protein n=1 Tax=Anguilla anguilla TaxID=7936 RepID=A0A0E9TRR1_ANGAN
MNALEVSRGMWKSHFWVKYHFKGMPIDAVCVNLFIFVYM